MSRSRIGALLAGVALLAVGLTGTASAADQTTTPPAARFALALDGGGPCHGGLGYGVDSADNLRQYVYGQQEGPNCDVIVWNANTVIDDGWSGVRQVFGDGDTIFAVDSAGDMRWYGYDQTKRSWLSGSGTVIGTGWDIFTHVAYAGDGVFYAVDGAGTLFWYRYLDPTGYPDPGGWYDQGEGTAIGSGFQIACLFFAARGAVYLSDGTGALFWYGYSDPLSPDGVWVRNSGAEVGTGWDMFTSVTATWGRARQGPSYVAIAALDPDDNLLLYRHLGPDTGTATWSPDSGQAVNAPVN